MVRPAAQKSLKSESFVPLEKTDRSQFPLPRNRLPGVCAALPRILTATSNHHVMYLAICRSAQVRNTAYHAQKYTHASSLSTTMRKLSFFPRQFVKPISDTEREREREDLDGAQIPLHQGDVSETNPSA
jgi:hypothetical protein